MEQFIEAVRRYPCLWSTTAAEYRDQDMKDAAWAEVMKDTELSSVKEVKMKWKKLRDSYRDALKRQIELQAKEPGAGGGKKNYAWKYMAHMQFLQPHMNVRRKPPPSPPASGASHAPDAPDPPDAPDAPLPPHATACYGEPAHNGDARSSSSSSSSAAGYRRREHCERRAPGRARHRADRLAAVERKLDYLCRAAGGAGAHAPAWGARGERKREPPPHAGHAGPAPPDPLDIFFNGMCQTTKRLPYPTQVKVKRALFEAVTEAEEALVAEQQSYASLWARGGGSSSSSEPDEAGGARAPDAPDAAGS